VLIPPGTPQLTQPDQLIASPKEAINVFDFEAVAQKQLSPAHWGYLATGVDDDMTIKANREGFTRYQIRVRRLVDVTRVDTSATLFGVTWPTPVVLAPVGSQRAFHPDGELAVARACRSKGTLFILSTVATASVEEVAAATGRPIWFQTVPHQRLEREPGDREARRSRGLPGARSDGRFAGRQQPRNSPPVRAP
jgi:hypothetical protein